VDRLPLAMAHVTAMASRLEAGRSDSATRWGANAGPSDPLAEGSYERSHEHVSGIVGYILRLGETRRWHQLNQTLTPTVESRHRLSTSHDPNLCIRSRTAASPNAPRQPI
jgi:hypothetical protein